MHDLRWILVGWGVCAVAAAFKFARLARAMRGNLSSGISSQPPNTEAMRARLERMWQRR